MCYMINLLAGSTKRFESKVGLLIVLRFQVREAHSIAGLRDSVLHRSRPSRLWRIEKGEIFEGASPLPLYISMAAHNTSPLDSPCEI